MTETIDPTQWLHQSVSKAYPLLLRKLGAIEHNGKITCSTQFGFDQLYRYPENDPIFDGSHLSAAEFITVLQEVAFRRTGHARFKDLIVDLSHGMIPIDGYCPMTLYVAIMRDIPKPHVAMIKRICFQELRSNDIGWIMQCAVSIRESFQELGKQIEISLDRMKTIHENSAITRPEVSLKSAEPVSGN